MTLPEVVHTFGHAMRARYGRRVHKVAVDAGFTCPNRDGSRGVGGCSFCNNASFSPSPERHGSVSDQLGRGRGVVWKRTGAELFLAYFQAYTGTYDSVEALRARYDEALAQPGVIGLSIGTRPDCLPAAVLDLLAEYRDRGLEVWVELGLQSSFDATLERVNRGHGYREYRQAARAVRSRGLQLCTHLMAGLPGEGRQHAYITLNRVIDDGVDGLKIHPLHVVRGTRLARLWRAGDYRPLAFQEYVSLVADLIEATPPSVIYHRLTGTAALDLLLTPLWCHQKWRVLNAIENELHNRGSYQGWIMDQPRERLH